MNKSIQRAQISDKVDHYPYIALIRDLEFEYETILNSPL